MLVSASCTNCRKQVALDGNDRQKQQEKEKQAKKQQRSRQSSSILQASQAFILATKEGPEYVCVCGNQLMYWKTVIEFKDIKINIAMLQMTLLGPNGGFARHAITWGSWQLLDLETTTVRFKSLEGITEDALYEDTLW